ncbi:MAG: hypothetical protein ABJC04_11860, partial [Verrucomicrobiota bacterium]
SVTEPEPTPLSHLRKYSNYLTPKLGFFSADTWVLVATYLRNLLLNWLVFIPLLLGLFAIPRFHESLLNLRPPEWVAATALIAAFLLAAWGMAFGAMNRPAVSGDLKTNGGKWYLRRGQSHFLWCCLLPLCVAALFATTAWSWIQDGSGAPTQNPFLEKFLEIVRGKNGHPPKIYYYCLIGSVMQFSGWITSEFILKRWRSRKWFKLGREFFLAITTGAVGGILLWSAAHFSADHTASPMKLAIYGCFAAPAFLLLFLAAATIFIGVSSNFTSDEDREWWARMGAWILIAIVGWASFNSIVLFGVVGLLAMPKIFATMGGLSGIFTLMVGHSTGTAATKERKSRDGIFARVLDKALNLAAPVALIALVAALSLATSALLVLLAKKLIPFSMGIESYSLLHPARDFWRVVSEAPWWLTGSFVLVCAFIGWGISRLINVNKFSLHAIYRNRLVRAYLGASNSKRDPNPFTGFDRADNLPMQDLRDPANPTLPQKPLHIVNMALNLVTGENLAWQQRKAETFTASTLHCGNFRLGYRFTKHYALGWAKAGGEKPGLSLGTAVAISGAAASPNQGYHSSATVALLMTLFNVRLGWWLGNPGAMGYKNFHDSAPRSPVFSRLSAPCRSTSSTRSSATRTGGSSG